MNSTPDSSPSSPGHSPGEEHPHPAATAAQSSANWQTALDSLITSRLALIQIESKEAATRATRALSLIILAALALLFAWALILTAGIHAIHLATQWPAHLIALTAGILHLLLAAILVKSAKPTPNPSFSITRAEFQKDREWLHQILNTKKSSD